MEFVAALAVFAAVIYLASRTLLHSISWIAIAVLAAFAALLLPEIQYLFTQDLITAGAFFLFLALIAQALLKVSIIQGLALTAIAWLLGTLFLRF